MTAAAWKRHDRRTSRFTQSLYDYGFMWFKCTITLAGNLVVGNAEVIAALVLMEMVAPGCPVIMLPHKLLSIYALDPIRVVERKISYLSGNECNF